MPFFETKDGCLNAQRATVLKRNPVSSIEHPVSSIEHPASSIQYDIDHTYPETLLVKATSADRVRA